LNNNIKSSYNSFTYRYLFYS